MSNELTPNVLAERRALWTELRDRGGQDIILTPEFALALLDALAVEYGNGVTDGLKQGADTLAAEKAAREFAEQHAEHWRVALRHATEAYEESIAAEKAARKKAEVRHALFADKADAEARVAEVEAERDMWRERADAAWGREDQSALDMAILSGEKADAERALADLRGELAALLAASENDGRGGTFVHDTYLRALLDVPATSKPETPKRQLMTEPHDGHPASEECPGCPHAVLSEAE